MLLFWNPGRSDGLLGAGKVMLLSRLSFGLSFALFRLADMLGRFAIFVFSDDSLGADWVLCTIELCVDDRHRGVG